MSQVVKLAFDHVASREPAQKRALFLHGMLGSGGNLRTIARRFVTARPDWDAWLIDLRGHGASPKNTPEPSLAASAEDVRALCAGANIGAVIGHSFGGKVALELLRLGLSAPHVVTLDSNPGVREPPRGGDSVLSVIDMLDDLPPRFASRAEFVAAVMQRGHSKTLAQWLALSTELLDGEVRFALDLRELRGLLQSYFAADSWDVVEAPPSGAQVHLVIAEKANSYSSADRQRAQEIAAHNPQVSVDFLATEHWVHAEDPDGVLRILFERIS